jgi:hypothetical protein
MRGLPHHFFGHAADIHTGPAKAIDLNYRRSGTMSRGATSGSNAATTTADTN